MPRPRTSLEAEALSGQVIGRALSTARLSQEAAATSCGWSKSTVGGWTQGDRVSLARLIELGLQRRALLVALGQELLALGEEGAAPGLPVERHGLRVARECGDVARVIEEATRDGSVDAEEAALIVRELDEAARAIEAARRDLLPIVRGAR